MKTTAKEQFLIREILRRSGELTDIRNDYNLIDAYNKHFEQEDQRRFELTYRSMLRTLNIMASSKMLKKEKVYLNASISGKNCVSNQYKVSRKFKTDFKETYEWLKRIK